MISLKRFFVLSFLFLSSWMVNGQNLHHLDKDLPCVDKHFNLMVHVAVDSLREMNFDISSLEAAVETCNKFFEPICVSFSICDVDTFLNYNFDVRLDMVSLEEKSVLHDEDRRLDIYILEELLGPSTCGLGGGGEIHLERGCLGSLTHEMGHQWGLAHTFAGNGEELVDGSNCETAGDGICDTPADPFDPADEETVWQNGCEFVYLGLDDNGQFYQPDMGNIMSYYGCDCGFTRGQYLRMAQAIENSGLW